MRLFRRKTHRAAVYDTHPRPGDRRPFDPYVIALCECGWVGEPRDDVREARADAYRHTRDVDEEVERPLGEPRPSDGVERGTPALRRSCG